MQYWIKHNRKLVIQKAFINIGRERFWHEQQNQYFDWVYS